MSKAPSIQTNEGPQNQYVRIKTQIFTNPDSTFPITLKPSKVAFPDTGELTIVELYFSIINVSKQNVRPTLISSPKSLVSVTLPKSIPAGGYADGSIKLKNAGQKKGFEKSVTIQLNDTANTRFTIPVTHGPIAAAAPAAKVQAGH
jgi:hypothetical protein